MKIKLINKSFFYYLFYLYFIMIFINKFKDLQNYFTNFSLFKSFFQK